jgi:hypothetical protein
MKRGLPTVEENPYSVLKLSVTRLMHIREVQATGGGHFAQVARELGYVREKEAPDEEDVLLLDRELAVAEQQRKKRNDSLVERLRAARERLGANAELSEAPISSAPPPPMPPSQRLSLPPREPLSLAPPLDARRTTSRPPRGVF